MVTHWFVCTHTVNARVGPGDSGSSVFVYSTAGDTASLAGQLFAAVGTTTFLFSPLNNLQAEFGLLPATVFGQ